MTAISRFDGGLWEVLGLFVAFAIVAAEPRVPWPADVPRQREILAEAKAKKEPTKPTQKKPRPRKPQWPPVCVGVLGFPGCPKCEAIKLAIRQLKREGLHVYYWDIYKRPKFTAQFKARGRYPHIALIVDGRIVQQHDGFLSGSALREWYQRGRHVRAGKAQIKPTERFGPMRRNPPTAGRAASADAQPLI